MIYPTTSKTLLVTPPAAAVNNAAVVCASVDRKGFDYAVFTLILGATDANITACKMQESDDNSTWSDVSGLDFSVSPATLPRSTDTNHLFAWDVDLRGRKRYLRPAITVASGSTGAFVCVIAELHRAEQTPSTAAGRGLTGNVAA
jgi:hypothetical protein